MYSKAVEYKSLFLVNYARRTLNSNDRFFRAVNFVIIPKLVVRQRNLGVHYAAKLDGRHLALIAAKQAQG